MDKQLFDRIYDFITGYQEFDGVDFSLEDLLDNNVDSVDSLIDFITNYLDSSDYTDFVYYDHAMDFLKSKDPSLSYPLGVASDYGLDLKSVDSVVLANLLFRSECDEVLYSEEFRQGLEEIFTEYSE